MACNRRYVLHHSVSSHSTRTTTSLRATSTVMPATRQGARMPNNSSITLISIPVSSLSIVDFDHTEKFQRPKITELRAKAQKGDAEAQYTLGFMYANGEGVSKNEAEAVKWYRKAADQGYATAQINLGLMYENGQGVPKDEAEAYKWCLLAGAQGDENAKKSITILERTLTPAQRAEGQRMAREFKPVKSR